MSEPWTGGRAATSAGLIAFDARVAPYHVLVKNYGVLGLHWGAYNLHDPAAIRSTQQALYDLHAAGSIKPLISSARPMSEAPAAMAAVASRATTGKVLLLPAR